jgi:hypothetical protein
MAIIAKNDMPILVKFRGTVVLLCLYIIRSLICPLIGNKCIKKDAARFLVEKPRVKTGTFEMSPSTRTRK